MLLKPLLMNKITPLDNSWMIRNLMILASIYDHISRKKYVNAMYEGNIPMITTILLCGGDTKSLHTILSSVFTSM